MVREMERPNTPLPEPGFMTPDEHIQIRDRLWEDHLPMELDKDNRLQVSEKIWGSVAHTIIALGKQRDWKIGRSHGALERVVVQLGAELDEANGVPAEAEDGARNKLRRLLSVVNGAHDNFYRNDKNNVRIGYAERDAAILLSRLEPLLDAPPQPYTPQDGNDQRRLAALLDIPLTKRDSRNQEGKDRVAQLDQLFPRGKTDPNGFSPNYGYRKPGTPDDDGGEAHPVARPPSGSPPPEGSRAKPIPQSGQGATPKVNLKPGKQLGQGDAVAGPSATGRRTRRSRSKDEQPTNVNIKFG